MPKGQFLIAAMFLLAVPLAAQQAGSPAQSTGAPASIQKPIQVHVNLVNVLFTVNDKKGRMVLDLNKDDFRVFEDGKPQTISFFSRETDLPLRIGILIDTSNSIAERLRFEQEAAIDFLNETLRPGEDQAFAVGFDVEPQLLQDYTDDVDKLSSAIRDLRAGGTTSLFDAIFFACKQKMVFSPPPVPYLRRVLIVVSDGLDNESEHTRDEAISMAQRAEATIFCISTNNSGADVESDKTRSPSKGDKVLERLAQQTGGRVFFPFEARDLASSFEEIARELRSQYSLAYTSSNPAKDGTFRTIELTTDVKGLKVRAKAGYFAPSQ